MAAAYDATVRRLGAPAVAPAEPELVEPGSLRGAFGGDE
jgi:hypothetical protein